MKHELNKLLRPGRKEKLSALILRNILIFGVTFLANRLLTKAIEKFLRKK